MYTLWIHGLVCGRVYHMIRYVDGETGCSSLGGGLDSGMGYCCFFMYQFFLLHKNLYTIASVCICIERYSLSAETQLYVRLNLLQCLKLKTSWSTDKHVQEFCHCPRCLANKKLFMILPQIQSIRKFK